MNTKQLINDNWKFAYSDLSHSIWDMMENISPTPVELPHDWLIYDTNNLYLSSRGWYFRELFVNDLEDKKFILQFEGIYMNCTIYVNKAMAGEWKYGYSTFEIDITDYLTIGKNRIDVEVIYESPNSRWYSGAGIYRNVWLLTLPNVHIPVGGIYVSAKKQADNRPDCWRTEIDTELSLPLGISIDTINVKHAIIDKDGTVMKMFNDELLQHPVDNTHLGLNDEENQNLCINKQILFIGSPNLWDIESPYVYTLKTELLYNGCVIQTELISFGFRTMEFIPDKGFIFNGRLLKMQGVCQHHDLGCLGAAVNKQALRRQFLLLREMGVNAIRTSHNMPAVELMELADEMGFLIVSEGFDMWERKKTTYDYARFFNEWVEKDVRSWIRRDRNHPSICMWSIGNEIYDTHADEQGQIITRMLMEQVLTHDPKKNGVVTIGSNYMPWENAQKCADIVKIAGYNYAESYYDKHHALHPDWVIYGSETSSVVQSRSIYHFPLSSSLLSDDDEQCSSLGNSQTSWGAKSTECCIIDDRDTKYSLGQFLWSGFDYIGEPTPYSTKNSYFGQLDTAGFKKDSFYIYQAEWTNYKDKPMVHIFPYWDFSPGQLIDVRVCSNAERIELFFNDESLGDFIIDHAHGKKLIGEWQIPYSKGTLKALAYDEAGNVIASDVRTSFGDAKTLTISTDKEYLLADGQDLIFAEISVVDDNKVPVENANNRVEVCVTGAARLIGLDNGDSTDYDQYKGTSRRLFGGKLLAVIAAKLEPGDIYVDISSPNLDPVKIKLTALPCKKPEGIDAFTKNSQSPHKYEIPVRKIELTSSSGNHLNNELDEITINATLFPKDSTYTDITWRVTNEAGIDSNLAIIKPDGLSAVIKALGDGKVVVRCCCNNGSNKIRLISQLEFYIDGMGTALMNPYEFICGGLYTYSNLPMTNGNDRGVATLRDGKSHVCYEGLDFGEYGSDEITIPIFNLDSEELPIEIWEGIPNNEAIPSSEMIASNEVIPSNEGIPSSEGRRLCTVIYHKVSKWNTYQEETYILPKRLTGITTLSFVLSRKVHIKGFIFKKLIKAYMRLYATECSQIYGDAFNITKNAIEDNSITGIGNNVSVVFDNMDFSDEGFKSLIICGNSPIDKNTIHISFSGLEGESRQLIEFLHTDGYEERKFMLENVKGCSKVTFIFLPGSNFDFKWFMFE